MKKRSKLYLTFVLLFLAVFMIPKAAVEQLRERTIAFLAFISQPVLGLKNFWFHHVGGGNKTLALAKLELENQLLQGELERLKELFAQEQSIIRNLKKVPQEILDEKQTQQALVHHQDLLLRQLLPQLHIVPAQVIYRNSASWSSTLWVNVGNEENQRQNREVIAKNSPVLYGKTVVGVIDYVGEKQSRVRLITDSKLFPSVRSARGGMQRQMVFEQTAKLLDRLNLYPGLLKDPELEVSFKLAIDQIRRLLADDKQRQTIYLAKGELQGVSKPLWRSRDGTLKGIGFNYDFADEEGPARDLRTGQIFGSMDESSRLSLLQLGDLLVTTGMDGVFPAGFEVAEVTLIHPLREGDYYYEIEAAPLLRMDDLTWLFIIPPVSYNFGDYQFKEGMCKHTN